LLQRSPSQAVTSADRANRARLLVRIRRERGTILEPIMENIVEFLVHGVRYAFPPEQGPVTRGVKTLHGAPIVSDRLLSESAPPVWPSPEGGARGDSLEPLHRSVPSLASDPRTHAIFATIDLLRVGGARERKTAELLLRELLGHPK